MVFPTSFGKSLLYLIPGLIQEGTTVIVCPILSLIKDQVAKLEEKNIPVANIDSSVKSKKKIYENLGKYKFVYITPEQLSSNAFKEAAAKIKVCRLVVDEAHCVVSWGFSFRKSYLRIPNSYKALGNPPVLALTATATDLVKSEIKSFLKLPGNCGKMNGPIVRDDLAINVEESLDKKTDIEIILDRNFQKRGIIYCSTIKECNKWMEFFHDHNKEKYYGVLSPKNKELIQKDFQEGAFDVLITTSSFGLGVDIDVDYVVVANLMSSVEEYYQMIGRAGRHKKVGYTYLLWDERDLKIQNYFINRFTPRRKSIEELYYYILASDKKELNLIDLSLVLKIDPLEIDSSFAFLKENSFLNYSKSKDVYKNIEQGFHKVMFVNWYEMNRRRDFKKLGLKKMYEFVKYNGCFNEFLGNYFNQSVVEPECLRCSNCLS